MADTLTSDTDNSTGAAAQDNRAGGASQSASPASEVSGTQRAETPPSEWDNDTKPVSSLFLFHRVHSPVTNADVQAPDGKGFDCGCRNLDDYNASFLGDVFSSVLQGLITKIPVVGQIIQGLNKALKLATSHDYLDEFLKFIEKSLEGMLFARYLGTVPEWVPVNRKTKDFKEEEREIEGLVMRSLLGDDDTPYIQWMHWYGWTFQVAPMPLYANVRGPGNRLTPAEMNEFTDDPDYKHANMYEQPENQMALLDATPGSPDYRFLAVNCRMDTGAFYLSPAARGDSANDNGRLQNPPGPMFDPNWPFWPMADDYFWAVGRWVYDCTHRTSENPKDDAPNSSDLNKKAGLMPTELHPLKAWACARAEAVVFDETEGYVPATQFLFFASKLGGYHDFDSLKDKDYEFIVDLPTPPDFGVEWSIGPQPPFPFNTGVLPPRARILVERAPFGVSPHDFAREPADKEGSETPVKFGAIDPIIEVIPSDDPQHPPRQVRVTIPLTQLGDDIDVYGVLISLGWEDRDGSLRDRVKKVTVTFDQLAPGDDASRGHWRLQMSANGRWRWWGMNGLEANHAPYVLKQPPDGSPIKVEMFVPDDRAVRTAAHGMKRRGIGEIFEGDIERRTLSVGGLINMDIPADVKTLGDAYKYLPDDLKKKYSLDKFEEIFKDVPLDGGIFGKAKPVVWDKDIDTKIGNENDEKTRARASSVVRELSRDALLRFDARNDPLGVIEPFEAYEANKPSTRRSYFPFSREGDSTTLANPYFMRELIAQSQQPHQFRVQVFPVKHSAATRTHFYKDILSTMDNINSNTDYTLTMSMKVEDQPPPARPKAQDQSAVAPPASASGEA